MGFKNSFIDSFESDVALATRNLALFVYDAQCFLISKDFHDVLIQGKINLLQKAFQENYKIYRVFNPKTGELSFELWNNTGNIKEARLIFFISEPTRSMLLDI